MPIKVKLHANLAAPGALNPGLISGVTRIVGTDRLYQHATFPGLMFKYHVNPKDVLRDCQGIAFQVYNGTTLSPVIHVAVGEHAEQILSKAYVPGAMSWGSGSPNNDTNLAVARNQAFLGAVNDIFDHDVYSTGCGKTTRMLAPTPGVSWPAGLRDDFISGTKKLYNVMGVVCNADFGYICSNPSSIGYPHSAGTGLSSTVYGQVGTRITLGKVGQVLRGEAAKMVAAVPSNVRKYYQKAILDVADSYENVPLLVTVVTQWENVASTPRARSGISLPSLGAIDRSGNPQDLFIPVQSPERPFSPCRIVTMRTFDIPDEVISNVVSQHLVALAYDWPTGLIMPAPYTAHTASSFAKVFKHLLEAMWEVDPALNAQGYAGPAAAFNFSIADRKPPRADSVTWANSYYGHPMIQTLMNAVQRIYDLTESYIREEA